MFPDIEKNPRLHNHILNVICALPFIGLISGNHIAMAVTSVIACIAALPYFAALFEHQQQQEKSDPFDQNDN